MMHEWENVSMSSFWWTQEQPSMSVGLTTSLTLHRRMDHVPRSRRTVDFRCQDEELRVDGNCVDKVIGNTCDCNGD